MPATATKHDVSERARLIMVNGIVKATSVDTYGGAMLRELMAGYCWFELWNHPEMDRENGFVLVNPLVIACGELAFHIEDTTIRRWYRASRKGKSYDELERAWDVFLELAATPFWVRISDAWFIPAPCRGQRVRMAVMSNIDAVTEPYADVLAIGVHADRTPFAAIPRHFEEYV